ncbi:hypothetical protein NX059_000381 [Plenodomus lindquistii]|nr:hypothetical protein NX059_000381 [Plenodomus lindquistii]
MDFITEIERVVHDLKVDRDTWEALAVRYKTAFEHQSRCLRELQDVCFATQAELENERAQQLLPDAAAKLMVAHRPESQESKRDIQLETSYGIATIYPPGHRLSNDCANPLFDAVQCCVQQQKYDTALVEIERLLRGPLSPKARTEGLLLKCDILRAMGPTELYDALAACSEALELCDRLSGLEVFLPRIHYQRGLLYYDLRVHVPPLDAVNSDSDTDFEYGGRVDRNRHTTRRSGFDENRTINEELLAKVEMLGTRVIYSFF